MEKPNRIVVKGAGEKLGGVGVAERLYKNDKKLRIYGHRNNGAVWAEKPIEEVKDDENIIDITEILKRLQLKVTYTNIKKVMEPLLIEKGEPLYKSIGKSKTCRGSKISKLEQKNGRACAEIEDRNSNFLKDIELIGEKGFNRISFEKLCYLQCSKHECMFWFGYKTEEEMDRAVKAEYGMTFKEAFWIYRQGGFISLRRSHWKMAESVPSMNKFLSINYLGMSDSGKKENETDSKVDKLIEAIKAVE